MSLYENQNLCKKCGGKCCLKSGCDYSAKDFKKLDEDSLYNELAKGNISIVACFSVKEIYNEEFVLIPTLYLRARNTNRDVVDLLSMKTKCSMLTDTGCSYDIKNRPLGGVNLVPGKNRYIPDKNPIDIVKTWSKHQKVLCRLVTRITGLSVEEKLKEDVYKLIYDINIGNFEYVTREEQIDIYSLIKDIIYIYPDLCNKAIKDSELAKKLK